MDDLNRKFRTSVYILSDFLQKESLFHNHSKITHSQRLNNKVPLSNVPQITLFRTHGTEITKSQGEPIHNQSSLGFNTEVSFRKNPSANTTPFKSILPQRSQNTISQLAFRQVIPVLVWVPLGPLASVPRVQTRGN